MSTKPKPPVKPLPLSDVLRDLAVLRASGRDISELFKISTTNDSDRGSDVGAASLNTSVDSSVSTSYEYIRVSRAAIRLHDSGKVETQGAKIEEVRNKYEDLLDGLKT
ncbi:hypothetical protein BDZ97DRAFT_1912537 [Flammula alnicola]|nr:hypothetical protein BDZ97DRAFT_1912537 [Flammula alnicola]